MALYATVAIAAGQLGGHVAWQLGDQVARLGGHAAMQLGDRAAAGRPAIVAVVRPVDFVVGRRAATAENTKYIFRSGGSARQRKAAQVQRACGFRWL